MGKKTRVLVVAHGHPDFDYGGGEVAAYNLFKALKTEREPGTVQFLARVGGTGATGVIRPRRDHEYLWQHESRHHFLFLCSDRGSLERFAEFLRFARPDVVFINHYVHIGLDVLMTIKRTLPSCRLYLTLHEMLAICNHNGQMVKTGGGLCYESTLDDCARCFPGKAREDFWLRKRFIQRYFDHVDSFIAPSWFLRNRYVEWGLPAERIHVIENVHPARAPLPPRESADGRRNRFGYFGQINRYKGLDVLLAGLQQLPEEERGRIQLEINGANLEKQPAEFQERIRQLLDPLLQEGTVSLAGSYAHHELEHRLKAVDWVVMPSIWWENSPMIIQEALGHGRPVICPAIGGMGEKVEDGVTGLHVPQSTPYYWTQALRRAAADARAWDVIYSNLQHYGTELARRCAREHLALV